MNMKRAISVLLTVILVTVIFVPTGLAEGEGVQLGAESAEQAEQPGEQPSESPSESFGNQSNEEISYFSVEFRDWDGTSLGDVQTVAQGSDAAAPAHPVRDGYEPDGWDKPFTSVQSDLVVTAQYKLAQNADMPDAAMMSMPLSVEPMAADNNVTVYIYIYLGNKEDNLLVYYKITDITADELEALQNKRPKLKGPDLLEALDNLTSEDLSRYVLTPDKYTKDSFEVENTSESGVYKVLVHLKSNIDTENTHDIIFRVDGVEYDRIEDVPYGADLTEYDMIAAPTKTGHTFSGWSPAALPATMPDEDVIISGSFTVNTHDIIFRVDGVEYDRIEGVPFGADLTEYDMIAAPAKTGHTFSGWSALPAMMPDEDVIISGSFTVNTHNIICEVDGERYTWKEDVPYGTDLTGYLIAEPTKTGHTFSGWSALPATMPDEDVTVIGSFTVNTYTVRFFAADGVTQIGAAQTVAWGGAAAPVTPPTRTGFTFDTWRLTGDDDTVATSLSDVRENIDAVAVYTRNNYTVTFVDYDGAVLGTYDVLYGDAVVPANNPTREGYTFTGWDLPLDFVAGNLRVTAQYAINIYTVTFVDYDGTVLETDSVTYGSAAVAPNAPSREGYTFTGWDIPFNNVKSDLTVTATYTAIVDQGGTPQTGGTTGGIAPQTGEIIDEAAPQAGGGNQIIDEVVPQAGGTAEEAVPQTGEAMEEEPIPAAVPAAQQDLSWMWWLLLLLLIPLLLLLLLNVFVKVYGRDEKGQVKLLRTVRRLKRKRDEVIVSLKARHVSGSTHGMVELSKVFTRRMRDCRLILEVEGDRVISVAIPRDADGRFQVRIDGWGR